METPISPEQRRPSWIQRIFGRKSHQAQQTTVGTPPSMFQSEMIQPELKSLKTEEPKTEERQLSIGTNFVRLLKEKGVIIPEEERFDSSIGVSALKGTNETLDPNLIEKVRSQQEAPDGYLIGIGAGNVVTMLRLFPEGKIPKAMILFDIDHEVVREGKKAIERLRDKPNERYYNIWSDKSNPAFEPNVMVNPEEGEKLESVLKQLAKEGNLVIERADFTDQRLIAALNELPDLDNSNNVIYLSNISDHTWRRTKVIPNFNFLESLTPKSPLKNYYVDTVQQSLNYRLRIGTSIPKFDEEDFKMRSLIMQTKPTDEIDGPQENPLYEDTSTWNIEKLMNTYQRMKSSPSTKGRSKYIEARIKQDRDQALKEYGGWKNKAQEPPEQKEEVERVTEYLYIVPTDPSEEEQVQKELAMPYDYEKDFIPFIADNIWRDKVTAREIYFLKEYKRDLAVTSIERTDTENSKPPFKYKVIYTYDPRQQMKGRIENAYLEKNTYEELVMAKLYREVGKRILANRPDADVVNKNFEELVEQISS